MACSEGDVDRLTARVEGSLRTRSNLEIIMTKLLSGPTVGRARVPVAAALAVVCVVHLLDGPGSLQDQFYVGALELALAAACVPLLVLLLIHPSRALWRSALVLNAAALIAYLLSRTVGLPGSTDDVGNWGQALGVVNVFAEVGVIALAAAVLSRQLTSVR
jgi:hypothetical protein